jgi:chromosomal replication initiator protein
MDQYNELWQKTLAIFKNQFEDSIIFDSYFAPLKIRDVINNDIIVIIETQFNLDIISEETEKLERILNSMTQKAVHIRFMLEDEYEKNNEVTKEIIIEDHLSNEMTFDNFVIGNSNRIAENAALAVAMKPGISYSPLFIHSQSGLGKTHLLNAIGNFIKKKNNQAQILYVTSEEFVNEYISHIQMNKMDDFNKKYRNIDVLLIDDIQFLATKESSSEVLFNIFNELKRNKKQIVITSDKPPRELKGMEGRLVSRFTQGLTVSIDTPEFETSKAILRKKIEVENVDYPISEEVLDFIASHFNKDVRELEGSLKRLLFYKLICGKKVDIIDLDFALEAFADSYIEEDSAKSDLTVDIIKKTVADYYNLTVSQINSKSRTSNIITARHIAMYLVRKLLPETSYIQIGHEFGGRDHSTVMKACDKVSKNMKKDSNYNKAIEEIKSKLS